MKKILRRYAILLAVLVVWMPLSHTQTPPRVGSIEIKHVGPPAVSDELILSNIRVKQGDPYNRNAIDDDVRNLYATGYFYNIRVAEEQTPEGLKLVYIVQGKPTLTDITFAGNEKYSDSRLSKKISSKVGEPLDEQKLFLDTRKILEQYQKAGHQKTEVEYVLNINENAGRGTATFEITEAPKVRIKEVQFVGNEAFKTRTLRKKIKTRNRHMFSWLTGSGVLKDEQFADDKEKLADFYRNEGYIDFEIENVDFEHISRKKMIIRFHLSEGTQYQVGTVEIKGNSLYSADEIRARLRMTENEIFTPVGLNDDLEAVRDFYGAKGYIDARIRPNRTANVETGTMDIAYEIEENDQSYIEKIEIKGNTKTKDKVIRRELAVSPGEVFNMVNVKLSEQRLKNMDYFSKVDAQPEPTDVPNRQDLVIGVEEKNTGNLTFGAGFSSVDALVGFAEVTQGNFDLFKPPTFTGGGQKFRLRAQLGTRRQDYLMSFVEPWFLGRKLALGVDLFHRELDFVSDVFDERRTGGTVSLTRALGSDFLIGSVSYTLENIEIQDVDPTLAGQSIKDEEGARWASRVGASIAYDTRRVKDLLPYKGFRTELATAVSGGPLGGQTHIYRIEVNHSHYFPGFFEDHIFELHGATGVVDDHDGSGRVPLFDRNFLGGQNTLRGFRFRQVGPRDEFNNPIGGSTYWFGSAEYSVPVVERVRFAVFYDIGMVYQQSYSFNSSFQFPLAAGGTGAGDSTFYNDNFGFGVRLNLPIGPLRLDYGIPISGDGVNDNSGRFQFGAGYTREF